MNAWQKHFGTHAGLYRTQTGEQRKAWISVVSTGSRVIWTIEFERDNVRQRHNRRFASYYDMIEMLEKSYGITLEFPQLSEGE